MTAPRPADCKCSHTKLSHEVEDAPACCHETCGCQLYRPRTSTLSSMPSAVTAEQLLAAGKRSASKRVSALAEKIAAQLEDLRAKLHAERQAAEEKRRRDAERSAARAEVERLERELAAARARAKGGPPPQRQEHRASSGQRVARLHPHRLRPHVRHRTGPGDARAPRARRIRPQSREGRVSA